MINLCRVRHLFNIIYSYCIESVSFFSDRKNSRVFAEKELINTVEIFEFTLFVVTVFQRSVRVTCDEVSQIVGRCKLIVKFVNTVFSIFDIFFRRNNFKSNKFNVTRSFLFVVLFVCVIIVFNFLICNNDGCISFETERNHNEIDIRSGVVFFNHSAQFNRGNDVTLRNQRSIFCEILLICHICLKEIPVHCKIT